MAKKDIEIDGKKAGMVVIGVLVFIGLIVGVYFTSTESGKRSLKNFSSNVTGGLTRTVKVYDNNQKVIYDRCGKFDVINNNGNIEFIDSKTNKKTIMVIGDLMSVFIEEVDKCPVK